MTGFARADRVAHLIQQIVAELLRRDISDPRLQAATITDVKVTRDLRVARVNEVAAKTTSALRSSSSCGAAVQRTRPRSRAARAFCKGLKSSMAYLSILVWKGLVWAQPLDQCAEGLSQSGFVGQGPPAVLVPRRCAVGQRVA